MKKRLKTALFIAIIAMAGPAAAGYENVSLKYEVEQPRKLGLRYDVYAGGIKALNAELTLDLERRAYDLELKAQTQGFIGSLFPWRADYTTSGHAEKGMLIPSLHTASSTWREARSTMEMTYDPIGRLLKTSKADDNGKREVNRAPDPALTRDSVDLLTGTLMLLQTARRTSQCKGSFPVFDGKRRFEVKLKDEGKEMLPKSRYSAFSGEALKCTLNVTPLAGFTKKDEKRGWLAVQNHTQEHHMPPTLWLARLENKGPVVPVRMEIRSAYGAVVAHLSGTATP
jgi:Protein of unknown function (DUF3108)